MAAVELKDLRGSSVKGFPGSGSLEVSCSASGLVCGATFLSAVVVDGFLTFGNSRFK